MYLNTPSEVAKLVIRLENITIASMMIFTILLLVICIIFICIKTFTKLKIPFLKSEKNRKKVRYVLQGVLAFIVIWFSLSTGIFIGTRIAFESVYVKPTSVTVQKVDKNKILVKNSKNEFQALQRKWVEDLTGIKNFKKNQKIYFNDGLRENTPKYVKEMLFDKVKVTNIANNIHDGENF